MHACAFSLRFLLHGRRQFQTVALAVLYFAHPVRPNAPQRKHHPLPGQLPHKGSAARQFQAGQAVCSICALFPCKAEGEQPQAEAARFKHAVCFIALFHWPLQQGLVKPYGARHIGDAHIARAYCNLQPGISSQYIFRPPESACASLEGMRAAPARCTPGISCNSVIWAQYRLGQCVRRQTGFSRAAMAMVL